MKSPFVEKKSETYTYPAPLDPKEEEERVKNTEGYESKIDPEIMAEDTKPWISLRIPRSKADVDAIADMTQSLVTVRADGAQLQQRIKLANQGVFELLVENWSFDAEANGANFARLDIWAADWISACIADAVAKGTTREWAEKNGGSSNGRSNSRSKRSNTAAAA